ncbi:uncharacterized protein METZ01_LOCUS298193 [marine metagenome]|uniref:Uncharacterized protein n=1 Tax=marine metagenome TaxID=408172 RepID=A0A382M8X3_9ZZZZ
MGLNNLTLFKNKKIVFLNLVIGNS